MSTVDLVVLGAGTAGLVAARTARSLGATVALVERERPGGDCTFTGCVPSKTLLAAAAAGADLGAAAGRVRATVERVAATEDAATLRHEGIEVISGEGEIVTAGAVEVDGRRTSARRGLLVATGARPVLPPILGLDEVDALTTETVFDHLGELESLVVLGGGPVGVEMSQALARLGVEVTLVESAERLVSSTDARVGDLLAARLAADGVDIRLGRSIVALRRAEGGLLATLDDGSDLAAGHLLVAVGRRPTLPPGLVALGVQLDAGGGVIVDQRMRTTVEGVLAAGDTVSPAYTHVAGQHGHIAANTALRDGWRRWTQPAWDGAVVPSVVFTTPEVATVGLSEARAAREVPGARVAEVEATDIDRAVVEGETDGFVQLVTGPRHGTGHAGGGRVLGATIVGPRAGELIAEVALAMRTGAFAGRLAQTVHAYPTWSVGVQTAAAKLVAHGFGDWRPARDPSATT